MKKLFVGLTLVVLVCGCSVMKESHVLVGVGGAYIPDVPTTHLTGRKQFHISVEYVAPLWDDVYFRSSWNHYSNGAHLGIGEFPNRGLDTLGAQVVWEIY